MDITLIKEAYNTLSTPQLRAQYDSKVQSQCAPAGPRPAQIISLEEFEEETLANGTRWRYDCRCGGSYGIDEDDMERGQHLVGCVNCSEVVWVGYEMVQDE